MLIEQKIAEQSRMERVFRIYKDEQFVDCMHKNDECEKERVYCRHGYDHLLAVARLGYIFSLERGYGIDKEILYATALLHDIGRWEQYLNGTPHDIAGARIADEILLRAGFDLTEREVITAAILSHRGAGEHVGCGCASVVRLQEVLYDADKMSRDCYACESEETCNWAEEKKNLQIMW